MVLGIGGCLCSLTFTTGIMGVGLVLGAAAAICGWTAKTRVERQMANNPGVATTGRILGILAMLIPFAYVFLRWT
ncbi:hypothetical protein GCM10022226_03370 [Sphaerisporangium flaviroseum]|uniref:DUF4190 domain-containing protein n=1 Tax=Sphaerisporangium flaviroseum TaxID=509199 RepID=A0ABP7H8B0_9ACTN